MKLLPIDNYFISLISLILIMILILPWALAGAEDFTSANFTLTDSIITMSGGHSSSANFEYYSSSGQLSSSEGTSGNFLSYSGYLYYPVASTPIISATAGDSQVSLTWTAAVGTLANVTNYQLGIATISGGPYTYVSVGNVTSAIKSGLTNGTTYYFKIKAYAGSLLLADSSQVSATPVASVAFCGDHSCNGTETCSTCSVDCGACNPGGGGGGGGGGGSLPPPATGSTVNFTGRAYPLSTVVLLKDAQVTVKTVAGPDAIFSVSLNNLSGGSYNFSLYGEDSSGRHSALLTFPITVSTGATTNVSGVFIAPTIAVDKSEVKKGDNLSIFGQTANDSDVVISVHSDQEYFLQTKADKNGVYLYNLDTSPLDLGQHATKAKVSKDGAISPYGQAIGFTVGAKNVAVTTSTSQFLKADLNNDNRVNLVDFSIAAYWYKRALSDSFKQTECERLNCDNKIDLVDFSVMAYYWTG